MPEKRWPVITARAFGIVHLGLGCLGLWWLVKGLGLVERSWVVPKYAEPHRVVAFTVLCEINFLFLALLLTAGVLLLVRPRRGITLSLSIFWGEIAFYLAQILVTMPAAVSHGPWRDALTSEFAGGNMGLAPQFITGYPILALVILYIIRRKMPASVRMSEIPKPT